MLWVAFEWEISERYASWVFSNKVGWVTKSIAKSEHEMKSARG